jgi:hypothetical protein
MAFEPDSLGMFESGKMNTIFHGAVLVDAPINVQIVDRSNALASGADFACATCSANAADGNAWEDPLVGPVKFGFGPPYSPRYRDAPTSLLAAVLATAMTSVSGAHVSLAKLLK